MQPAVHFPAEVKYKFAVFQRRPLDSLPRWKRWLVRRVYALVDWQTADGEEKQAICDTEAIAKAMVAAGGPHWFYHRLPVNVSLSAETVTDYGVRFPGSEASEFYERLAKRRSGQVLLCPHTGEVCRQHESLPKREIERAYEAVKKLIVS